ncbi:cation diffusion facilitator family transporter [Ammoniphilus sp. CFH 90114]|uniref:cation diffusion facilitator family transporter n=1 Tax=Ammoniphilus sp. CFH 90114 TaxID=2493665 RepID=UPI00100E112E|nr:cation diffusion facilitator family transporter [Ammoniphilus sp. CFH 90114]RXT14755.1 cation transporter [Ammoniphilus sp. CFH 90114]
MKEERFKKAEFAAWIGIVGNIVLAIVKGFIGYIANSKALIADAVHSASDVVGSLAVLIGLRAARKPPDEDHPYGHGKAESIAAIVVSIIMFVVGLEVASASFETMREPLAAPGVIAIYAAIISMVVKEAMFRYKYKLGKRLNSQALIANAWDHRSDVYSSLAALVGIGGAVLGGKLGIPLLLYLDPLAGIVVSVLVLKMAYNILKESVHNTLDHVIHEEDAKELVDAVEKVDGVISVDQLFAREHGHYVIVDVKVGVNPNISVEKGHAIGKEVKHTLMNQFEHVQDVMVHINPYSGEFGNDNQPEVFH